MQLLMYSLDIHISCSTYFKSQKIRGPEFSHTHLIGFTIITSYCNSHYFHSQIFYVRNFRVTIFSSISRVRHIFATYRIAGNF